MMRGNFSTHSPYGIDAPGREANNGPSRPSAILRLSDIPRGRPLRISDFCFLIATLSALIGMTLGIVMGILQDFTLSPAHAHLNLLGWVTMALFGLYHRSVGRATGWIGWTQVLTSATGAGAMSGGLALYLQSGDHSFFPLVIAGSVLTFLGMMLFVCIVLADLLGFSRAPA